MRLKGSQGSILIIALWILAIVVLFGVGIGYTLSLDQRLVSYQRDRLMALYLAKAGTLRVVAELEHDPNPEVDFLLEPAASGLTFQDVALGEGTYTVGVPFRRGDQEEPNDGPLDEDRKIGLNFASREVLLRLPGMTEEIADSILDWRDEDPFPHFLGAEDFYYRGLEPPYRAKNAPLEVLEELLWVRGMTNEIFQAIEPFVTVYTDGKVNLNTAPREVLMALGMGEGLVDKLLRYRRGSDDESFTGDDQIFTSLGAAEQQLNAFDPLTPQEAAEFTNLISQNLLKVKSEVFRITARGMIRNGKIVRSVEAVIKRGAKPVTGPAKPAVLLAWYED